MEQAGMSTQRITDPSISATITTLMPSDIKILACFGDSLLSGLTLTAKPKSMKNLVLNSMARNGIPVIFPWLISAEHRHNNCITGGSNSLISVGRLLRCFSEKLTLDTHSTRLFSTGEGFNFAMSGSSIEHLKRQVLRFVKKLERTEFASMHTEWKLIFVWIGANDVATKTMQQISRSFESKLVASIKILKAKVSKAFVYIMTLPNINAIPKYTNAFTAEIREKTELVNKIIHRVVSEYNWNDEAHFRVALQPIPQDIAPAEDMSNYLSHIDMIHPNLFTQQLFAKCIWNNLFAPDGSKVLNTETIMSSEWFNPGDTYFQ